MSRENSFIITLSNNKTEKLGINYLLSLKKGFYFIDKDVKKFLLEKLELPFSYLQSFDMVYIPGKEMLIDNNSINTNINELIFVELKTTKKYLPENPKGFFFGATENEFNFARLLGDKFRFCFVSLNSNSLSYSLLTLDELNARVRNKRIQYQINL